MLLLIPLTETPAPKSKVFGEYALEEGAVIVSVEVSGKDNIFHCNWYDYKSEFRRSFSFRSDAKGICEMLSPLALGAPFLIQSDRDYGEFVKLCERNNIKVGLRS